MKRTCIRLQKYSNDPKTLLKIDLSSTMLRHRCFMNAASLIAALLCCAQTITCANAPVIVQVHHEASSTVVPYPTSAKSLDAQTSTVFPSIDDVILNGSDVGELVFATVVFRHGDRTPIEPYPTDPWGSLDYWPEGFGQLTHIGKRQLYLLGSWLRQRYGDSILKSAYNSSDIYVRSTDYDRTLASAIAITAALFPPAGDARDPSAIWLADPNWRPVPVHTVPQEDDKLLLANHKCPRYDQLYAEMVRTHIEPLLQKHKHLIAHLEKNSGMKIGSDMWRVNSIYDTLYIESLRNMTFPKWAQAIWSPWRDNDQFRQLSDKAFVLETQTPELARLKYGRLLADILQRFRDKADGKLQPNRSLWLYSGHDTTLSGLLNTLGLFADVHGPPYASAVLFELRMVQKRPFFQLFYRKGWSTMNATNSNVAELIPIPMCGDLCPLDRMFELYAHMMPTGSIEEECSLNATIVDPSRSHATRSMCTCSVIWFVSLIGCLFVVLIV